MRFDIRSSDLLLLRCTFIQGTTAFSFLGASITGPFSPSNWAASPAGHHNAVECFCRGCRIPGATNVKSIQSIGVRVGSFTISYHYFWVNSKIVAMELPHLAQCRVSFGFASNGTVGKIMRETVALVIQFGEGYSEDRIPFLPSLPLCMMLPRFWARSNLAIR